MRVNICVAGPTREMHVMSKTNMEAVFRKVCEVFGFEKLNNFQMDAIVHILDKGSDIFVNLPTGYGKSVIFQAIPVVFDYVGNPIVIVVSPLVSLMKDQVARLNLCNIPSVLLTDIAPDEEERVLRGEFAVVFGSPESWLNTENWTKMVGSSVYKNRVKAVAVDEAHVISHWYATLHIYIYIWLLFIYTFQQRKYWLNYNVFTC